MTESVINRVIVYFYVLCLFTRRLYKEKLFILLSLLASQMKVREVTDKSADKESRLHYMHCIQYADM